ncbi:MAG: hypothetical protein IJL87_06020 [Clostridia bacterium]|nr:hypothetical protein [Clostridia bacterium]
MLDNSAYDYELFSPKREPAPAEPQVKALPQKKTQAAEKKSYFTKAEIKRYSIIFVIGILFLGCLIFAKSNYYELSREYSDCNEELSRLNSAYVCLEVTYEGNLSVNSIEDYAIEHLGMQVPDANQIKYITLTNEDRYEFLGKKTHASFIAPLLGHK